MKPVCLFVGVLFVAGCAPESVTGKPASGDSPFGLTGWATFRSQLPGAGELTYHSGFDGANTYQVPLVFVGSGATFSLSQSNVATVAAQFPVDSSDSAQIPAGITLTIVLVRTLAAGTTKITATHNGRAYDASLKVNAYAAGDATLGQARYDNPANANTTTRVSCASCHATLNKHATAFLADLTDDEILRTAVEGVGIEVRNPESGEITTYQPNGGNHTWDVTEAERGGITAYLRSRDPLFQLPAF